MQIVSNIALISINETLIVQLISFLIFFFIITRIMIRPIREIILERNKHVEKIIKEIIDSKEKIEELHRLIEEHKWNVIKEASSINKNLEITGKEEAARILDSIRQEIMEIKEKTDQEIRLKIQEARKMLNRESESLATAIMEKILKRRVLS